MSAIEKIYIDTNIFILAFENVGMATILLKKLFRTESDKPRFATSELTLSELLVRPLRDGNNKTVEAYEAVIVDSTWLNVVSVGRPVLRHAALLRANHVGLKLPDAIHVSTSFAAECSHIFTGDNGLKGDYEITADSATSRRAPLTVLRRDEPTLSSVLASLA